MSRYSYGYGYGDAEGYGGYGDGNNLGQVTQAIADSFVGPLAQIGATIGVETQKAQINKSRIKAGKQPCTGRHGQPFDCPSLFTPKAAPAATGTASTAASPAAAETKSNTTLYVVVGLLAVGGIAFFMMKNKGA